MAFPTFTSGDILNASDMNAVGLWLVKTQTVGTAVSSVEVTSCFSSSYDNYFVTWTGGTTSTVISVAVHMGTAPAASGYYGTRISTGVNGTGTNQQDNNATVWTWAGVGASAYAQMAFHLYAPYLSQETGIVITAFELNGASSGFGTYVGVLDNSTSYTGFEIQPGGAATMTGGTIRVYGYKN